MTQKSTFKTTLEDRDKRLDIYLSEELSELSRSAIKGLIKKGLITVNGEALLKAGHKLRGDELIEVTIPPAPETLLTPEDIALDIIFEDEHIVLVNKPASMTVHPGAGKSGGTLAGALLHHCDRLSDLGGELRPGIVHRLDKDTTGVMVAAKTNSAHASLSKQFKEHSTERRYHALVWGTFREDEGRIEKPLGRSLADRKKISTRTSNPRWAATRYRVLKRFPSITLLELSPETGRTHQIRVHLKSISHAIVGDPLYGAGSMPGGLAKPIADMIKGIKRQCLHAMELGLTHPENGQRLTFNAPYPEDMRSLIEALEE